MKKFNPYNGTFAASTLLAALVIAAELYAPFKTFLASVFTHHWIAKAVLVAAAFIIVGFACKKDELFGVKSEKISWYSILGSLAIIFLFYIIEFFI